MNDLTGTAGTEEIHDETPLDHASLWESLKKIFMNSAKAQREAKGNKYGNMGNQAGGSRAYSDASKALDEENN